MAKNPPANAGDSGSIPTSERSLKKELATHPGVLPGKSRGQRSLVGCSSWGCKSAGHSLVTKQQWLMMSNIFQINW